jgi:hypothetical protein
VSEIEELANAIRKLHGVESRHVESVPVRETFQGQTVWDGVVEVFDLINHPMAKQGYAWRYQDDAGKTQYTAVLKLPPVKSPQDAVKAAIRAQVKNEGKET